MKKSRITSSGVNAGSMADIAFLLLIFFLVTTTFEKEEGIIGWLPPPCPIGEDCSNDAHRKNVFTIRLNKYNALMVDDIPIVLSELRSKVKEFVSNNGDASCDYCVGNGNPDLSDNPKKAIISIVTDRQASYESYIGIQNELVGAYYELRKGLGKIKFQKNMDQLTDGELLFLKEAYPLQLTEASFE